MRNKRDSNRSQRRIAHSFRHFRAALVQLTLTVVFLTASHAVAQLKIPGIPAPAAPQSAPTTTAPATAVPSPTPSLAIPLPQIADQAEALDLQLETISEGLTTKSQGPMISDQAREIAERARQVDTMLENAPDIVQLREEIVYWRSLSRLSADQRRQLTERADQLQSQISILVREQATWQATQDSIHDTAGIEVVAARVQHELDSIRDIRLQAQTQLNLVLTQQNELSETGRRVSDTLAKLTEAESRFRVSIFSQDGRPLWSPGALGDTGRPVEFAFRRTASQEYATAREFFQARGATLLFLPAVFFLTLVAAFRLNSYLNSTPSLPISAETRILFAHPFAIALLGMLLLNIPLTESAPLSVVAISYTLWIVLLARLTPLLLAPSVRLLSYLLLGANLLEVLRAAVPLAPATRRLLMPLLIFAVVIAFGWLTRPARLRQLGLQKWPRIILEVTARIGLLLIAIAFFANIFGFISLSRILGAGTLLSAFFALALFFIIRIALLGLGILLEGPLVRYFAVEKRSEIVMWVTRLLILLAGILWWTRSELYVFMLQESLQTTIAGLLQSPIGIGKMSFTMGSVFAVLLILGIGFTLAKGISSLVRTVLVAHFSLQRGMPYAASKVTYYLLSVIVLLAAVSAAGVDLNRFTVITGAVGVGVGFGLQDIVKNFASGLILLFERPIRVDDTVEVNGLLGTVRRIGARSSTIATSQGSEVIVPNSTLVSSHVINWTLSSQQRRIEIPVGVAYGTDPEAVLALLVAEARSHQHVMADPAPIAYFIGFGDSALNFELRFWSATQDIWFQLKSEVTVGVARALTQAGIEIPFPQRDLHLRTIDGAPAPQPDLLQALASSATPKSDMRGDLGIEPEASQSDDASEETN